MEMAPSVVPEPPPPSSTTTSGPQQNLRNPLPLSPAQEAEVKKLYYKRVRDKCADVVKDFADCARGRTVSVAWACRAQHLAMNSCMISFATKAEQDAAREEWFHGVIARRQKREEELAAVEVRRKEVIDLTRRQEEKERLEAERKKKLLADEKSAQQKETGKGGGFWWR